METKDIIQLPLLDGTIKTFALAKVSKFYDVIENSRNKICVKSKFPWFYLKRERYTSFRIRTVYETINDSADPSYDVKLSLNAFLDLFGVSYKSADTAILEDTIKYG